MNLYSITEYGQRPFTAQCVASILQQEPNARIVVGDDGAKIKGDIPDAKIINWPIREDYVKNCNKSLKGTKERIIADRVEDFDTEDAYNKVAARLILGYYDDAFNLPQRVE